jgi:hypothetical protein
MTFPTIFTSAPMLETASGFPVDSDAAIDGAVRDAEGVLLACVVALGEPAKIFMCPFLDESRSAICEEAPHYAFTPRLPDCLGYFIQNHRRTQRARL